MTSYRIEVDAQDDGIFVEEWVGRWLNCKISAGFEDEFTRVASPARCVLEVNNSASEFFPEVTAGARIGRGLRVIANRLGVDYTLFTGVISAYEWRGLEDRMLLTAVGRDEWFEQRIDLPLFVDEPTSAPLGQLLSVLAIGVPDILFESTSGFPFCIIGTHSIGSSAVRGVDMVTDIEVGQTILPYYGGLVDEGRSVRQVVQELTASEGGYFFVSREDVYTFCNRQHTLLDFVPVVTLGDAAVRYRYQYGARVINRAFGKIIPREVYTGIVWTGGTRISLGERIEQRTFLFKSGDGRVMGLVPDTPITLNFVFEDGAGAVKTDVTTTIEARLDNGLIITFTKPLYSKRYMRAGGTISATVLVQGDELELVATAEALTYGRRDAVLGSLAYMSEDDAELLLNAIIFGRSGQRGYVDGLRLFDAPAMFNLELLDLVEIDSVVLNHNRLYRVLGWDYEIDRQRRAFVDYRLMPAYDEQYLIISQTDRNLIGTHWISW